MQRFESQRTRQLEIMEEQGWKAGVEGAGLGVVVGGGGGCCYG